VRRKEESKWFRRGVGRGGEGGNNATVHVVAPYFRALLPPGFRRAAARWLESVQIAIRSTHSCAKHAEAALVLSTRACARVELRARNVRVIHERGRDKCHSAALCAARVYESRARIVARTVAQRTTSARSRACGSSLRRFSVSRDPATYPNLTFPRFHESNRVESSRSDRSRQPASDGKRVTYVSDILCRAQA